MQRNHFLLSILAVAIIGIAGAWFLYRGFRTFRSGDPYISVVGKAERQIVSDQIILDLNLSALDKDRAKAYQQLQESKKLVLDYLASQGIQESDLSLTSINISEEYDSDYASGRYIRSFRGYDLRQTISIDSREIDLVEKVYQGISTLIEKGVDINIYAPRYYYTKLDDLKMEMLTEASKDAFNRASIIAKGSNSSVSKPQQMSMGVFQIVGRNSQEDYSWGGTFNTSSKIKTASITVRASYLID